MSVQDEMKILADRAVVASRGMARLSARRKNSILEAMALELETRQAEILEANARDLEAAASSGMAPAMQDRLRLTESRFASMVKGIRNVCALKDPVGARLSRWVRPNGIEIIKVRVPIGVIGIIYEARPNVTADAAVLCLKTGNAVILRGGSEAFHSNGAIASALQAGGVRKGLPPHAVQLIPTTDREAIRALVQREGQVDLVIPRGGEGLIRTVMEYARVPVIKHYKGVCHAYVHAAADTRMSLEIIENGKCQRPAVCNALEKVLVDTSIASTFLPALRSRLETRGVEFRGDPASCAILPGIKPATETDWYEEYNDLILTVKVVEGLAAAIEHINHYGSRHSDVIITGDESAARVFTQEVDSATVYVNASTRFTDGGEFGMGAEIGISTDKLHARGPMGLEELTTYKYIIHGEGQVRT